MRFIILAAALAAAGVPAVALAEALRIEPGLWEFTTSTPGAMGGPAGTTTSSECIRDGEMTPEKFTAALQGCKVLDPRTDATSMSWKLSCPAPQGTMTGAGSFTSTGTTVSGTMDMTMDMGGQEFSMRGTWKGVRKGDCR
jgi:hypothetical protein